MAYTEWSVTTVMINADKHQWETKNEWLEKKGTWPVWEKSIKKGGGAKNGVPEGRDPGLDQNT